MKIEFFYALETLTMELEDFHPIDQNLVDKYLYKILIGRQFKKIFGDVTFVKLTNQKELHYKVKYKTGLNKDFLKFNIKRNCSAGGLYFTTLSSLHWYMHINGKMFYYRKVDFPDDATIFVESKERFKANKFILSERKKLDELWKDEQYCSAVIQQEPNALKYAKQTAKLCLSAVQLNGNVISHVKPKFQTKRICLAAALQNEYAAYYITDPKMKNYCLKQINIEKKRKKQEAAKKKQIAKKKRQRAKELNKANRQRAARKRKRSQKRKVIQKKSPFLKKGPKITEGTQKRRKMGSPHTLDNII